MAAVMGGRFPGAWPPSATGRGTGPAGDKFSRSEDAGNGGRVRREQSDRSPPGVLLPAKVPAILSPQQMTECRI